MKKNAIGQSSIEYIIIFSVIIGALIVIGNRFFPKVRGAVNNLTSGVSAKLK